jgi:hypothetical protein
MLNFSKKIKIFLFEKSISENLSISKNQIICSKAAKVLWYSPPPPNHILSFVASKRQESKDGSHPKPKKKQL